MTYKENETIIIVIYIRDFSVLIYFLLRELLELYSSLGFIYITAQLQILSLILFTFLKSDSSSFNSLFISQNIFKYFFNS